MYEFDTKYSHIDNYTATEDEFTSPLLFSNLNSWLDFCGNLAFPCKIRFYLWQISFKKIQSYRECCGPSICDI